jgi:serine/threonine-protein kinase
MITGQLDQPLPFGRYTLTARVASGGMATVYRAEVMADDPLYGKPIALKVLHAHLAEDPQFVRMFKDEGRIAQQFDHPNVVRVYDVGTHDTDHFLAMEFVDGHDLGQIIQAHRLLKTVMVAPVAFEVLRQALLGLRYVHGFKSKSGRTQNVVHRDVSPQNLLISRAPAVKVTDFGIARGDHQSERTRTGTVKGKMHYMAPEQAQGDKVDARADLYALGAVAFELLTGNPLFGRATTRVLEQHVIKGALGSEAWAKINLHDDIKRWLGKALATRPEERFASADAMLAEMERLPQAARGKYDPEALRRLLDLDEARRSVQRKQQPLLHQNDDGRPRAKPSKQHESTLPPGTYAELPQADRHARLCNDRAEKGIDWSVAPSQVRSSVEARSLTQGDSAVRDGERDRQRRRMSDKAHLLPAEAIVGKSYAPEPASEKANDKAPGPSVVRPSSLRNPKQPTQEPEVAAPPLPPPVPPAAKARPSSKLTPEKLAERRGIALARFTAWSCGALFMFALVQELLGVHTQVPELKDEMFASLFDDGEASARSDAVPRAAPNLDPAKPAVEQQPVRAPLPPRVADLPTAATPHAKSVEVVFTNTAPRKVEPVKRPRAQDLTPDQVERAEKAARRSVESNAERMAWAGRPLERVEKPSDRPAAGFGSPAGGKVLPGGAPPPRKIAPAAQNFSPAGKKNSPPSKKTPVAVQKGAPVKKPAAPIRRG